MPGVSQVVYCAMQIERNDIAGRRVLDVGARDYNGSVRPLVEAWKPASYIGIDVVDGPMVDRVCSAESIVDAFGECAFDVILCVEMMEHARNWRACISNMKRALRPGGMLILTTRSLGYPCHGFPNDFWRYELADLEHIFRDFEIVSLQADPCDPGVFVTARKPEGWREAHLDELRLFCILTNGRERDVPEDIRSRRHFLRLAMKERLRRAAWWGFQAAGRVVSKALAVSTAR